MEKSRKSAGIVDAEIVEKVEKVEAPIVDSRSADIVETPPKKSLAALKPIDTDAITAAAAQDGWIKSGVYASLQGRLTARKISSIQMAQLKSAANGHRFSLSALSRDADKLRYALNLHTEAVATLGLLPSVDTCCIWLRCTPNLWRALADGKDEVADVLRAYSSYIAAVWTADAMLQDNPAVHARLIDRAAGIAPTAADGGTKITVAAYAIGAGEAAINADLYIPTSDGASEN